MNAKILQVPGLVVEYAADPNGNWHVVLFKDPNSKYATQLKCGLTEFVDDDFWQRNANRIKTLVFNRVRFDVKGYETESDLLDYIDRNYIDYSPEEKLANALEYISEKTSYDGQKFDISISDEIETTEIWRKYYFNNSDEFEFYIENLKNQGLIEYETAANQLIDVRLTLEGLTALININKSNNSRHCFVAMSFDENLKHVYVEAIKPALEATGYIPFILTERHVESERTINDEIIAGLKKSQFTIAEFTQHRHGVYFEAGFALGRGQKVIYICSRTDFSKAHFDTNHFQHIIWETTEDLKKQLIDKIHAFITD